METRSRKRAEASFSQEPTTRSTKSPRSSSSFSTPSIPPNLPITCSHRTASTSLPSSSGNMDTPVESSSGRRHGLGSGSSSGKGKQQEPPEPLLSRAHVREREAERLLGLSFEDAAGAGSGSGSADEDDRSLDEGEEVSLEEKKQVSVSHLVSDHDDQGGESDLNRSSRSTDGMLTFQTTTEDPSPPLRPLLRRKGKHLGRGDSSRVKPSLCSPTSPSSSQLAPPETTRDSNSLPRHTLISPSRRLETLSRSLIPSPLLSHSCLLYQKS